MTDIHYLLVEGKDAQLFIDEMGCVSLTDTQVFVPVDTYEHIAGATTKEQQTPQTIFHESRSIVDKKHKFVTKRVTRQDKIKEHLQ